ncbi:MAG: phospholipid carrier-dependent glycosyltransferase [Candidatus Eremiobacteraeota bacterium]|nr:phospholipid carrier-dependent glycosyltransferase [Candidatus Eremiobacteraeota bacterium]
MHERYVFDAFLLAPALMFVNRRYVWAAVLLSLTLLLNLTYSLHYLVVMETHVQNVDATNLWPWISRPCALLNVGLFFYLGYLYLGSRAEDIPSAAPRGAFPQAARQTVAARARTWFSPLEGTAFMLPIDYAIAAGLTVLSFALTYAKFWLPTEKYFDEIYYARAAEEYLAHKEIFEFTHPPLTKLLITLSTLLFGDNSYGWRLGNVVVGALTVFVLYLFAKRMLRSTPFATICAGMLVFDGFHFVQSRIATPEITVAFFALTTLYAFYRYWLASQVRLARSVDAALARREGVILVGAAVIAALVAALGTRGQGSAAFAAVFLYLETGAYLLVRLLLPKLLRRPLVASFAEGSRVRDGVLSTFDGGEVSQARAVAGEVTRSQKGQLAYASGELRIDYRRDASALYSTPEGRATFTSEGAMDVADAHISSRDATLWLWVLAFSAALLAASKWNGLFDFVVVFGLTAAVTLQALWVPAVRAMGLRVVPRPAQLGNPYGFSFDIVLAAVVFVSATIYVLTYIPYFLLGHNLAALIEMQNSMFSYHYDLHATHPYSSKWWQWPLLQIPISYYYKDFRPAAAATNATACCVAEILALPNPAVWWLGLVSIPLLAWLAWRERMKAYLLIVSAYLLQWLPWIASPRVSFEYHFYPNLAMICLADAVLLQRVWRLGDESAERFAWPKVAVAAFVVAVVIAFVFWYPILAGSHVSYNAWNARMWTWLMGQLWINPHPGQ